VELSELSLASADTAYTEIFPETELANRRELVRFVWVGKDGNMFP